MNFKANALVMALFPVFFAACGGGGGGGNTGGGALPQPTPASSTAEGVYGGTLTGSVGSNFEAVVLENGDFWALYGKDNGSIFSVYGFVQAMGGTSSNGSFTAANVKDFGFAPPLTGTLTSTYNSTAKTISGTVSYTSGTIQFSGGPIPGSLYNYSTAATLNTISGNWATVSTTGGNVTVSIAASGAVTTLESGCSGSGTIIPRPSGQNVFNVSLTFGAAPCALPSQTVTGIAIAYPLSTGQTQLIAAIENSTRTTGIAVFGIR
jgi:hypothetical protein